jgi:signal transduction histidine kinase
MPDSLNNSVLPNWLDSYQKILTCIARQIRSTLELQAIWQQTAESLGEVLAVSRCLVMSYDPQQKLQVRGEYCQGTRESLLGKVIDWENETYLERAITVPHPVIVDQLNLGLCGEKSALAVATFHQNQCNGLILLLECDRHRDWSSTEIDLVQELADQVGTAIAHATIYKELEQATLKAEEASRLKSEFLASTTHELRTPLNSIIGFLKLILDGMTDNPQEQMEFVEEAYKSSLHLLDLINDILDIAKIEADKIEIELGAVDLEEVLKSLENFTRSQVQQKNLKFEIRLPPTLTNVVVYANYQRLLQILLNLVGNAIKFTQQGEVIVTVEIMKKPVVFHNQEFFGMVKISVIDTGIGVPLEKQGMLFEKFFQVDGSSTRRFGGTGLGLAISKKLVEDMGGKISFYSMGEGLGSTVTFTIPLDHLPVMKTTD